MKITENGSPLILAQRARELKFPVLQKPNLGGYGRGMVRYTSIAELESKSRRAAAGRAELLAKRRHTDRLQNPAKLRRFWIRGGIRAG